MGRPAGGLNLSCIQRPQALDVYVVFNAGLTRDFADIDGKPATFRFDVVNLADRGYELRDGSGIGVFAPQYGERRGFFAGLAQRF